MNQKLLPKFKIKIVSIFPKYSALWNYGYQLTKYLSKNKKNNVEFIDLWLDKKYHSKIYRALQLIKGIPIKDADIIIIVAPLLANTLKVSEAKLKVCITHDFYPLQKFSNTSLAEKIVIEKTYSGIKYANIILPVSDYCISEIKQFYSELEKIKILKINGGINHTDFKYVKNKSKEKPKKSSKSNKPIFIHVGRDDPRKNFRFVLELTKKFNAKLIKVGTISKKDSEFIKENSLNVEIKNKVTETELAKLYSSSDMLLFPSTYEGLGLPPIEAMACGCPVLAANNTGLKEVCIKECLLSLNLKIWEKKINKILKDEIYRKNMIKKGLIKAKEFDWEKYGEKIEGWILRI